MSAIDEWKDAHTPKTFELAEEVIDELMSAAPTDYLPPGWKVTEVGVSRVLTHEDGSSVAVYPEDYNLSRDISAGILYRLLGEFIESA